MPSGEFEPGAVTRGRNTLHFGSVKGLVTVPSGIRFPEREASPTVITSIRTAQGKQVNLYKGSYALLIGVSDYTAGWPDLESIPGELAKLRVALEAKGFRVVTVMNPDSRRLEDSFKEFIDAYGYDRENRLLFYFSGHGYTRTVGEREKGYLVPADAPNPNRL